MSMLSQKCENEGFIVHSPEKQEQGFSSHKEGRTRKESNLNFIFF